jgi:phospho-N-acetylmuramoyl-pentapeptide-transferase
LRWCAAAISHVFHAAVGAVFKQLPAGSAVAFGLGSTLPHMAFWLAFVPFVVFVIFVLMVLVNAVNLTDGLDGLAIGCTIIAAGALTVLTYVSGHVVFSDYLELQRMPMVSELTVFCGAMVGASSASSGTTRIRRRSSWATWARWRWAAPSARSPSSSAGAAAALHRRHLRAGSALVMLQVGSYKLRNGKRIFKMAPLHHHFELLGWSESKVIARFWIGALVFALFALTTLKLR